MNSLIERYVAAAADDFPGSDNANITREVRAALEDMVESYVDQGMTQEEAERTAVRELGDPKKFADQFRQEPRYLIGPRLFRPWWYALRMTIAVVVPLFVVLSVLEVATNDAAGAVDFVGEALGGAFEGLLQAAFWVTLIFAIIQWTGQSSMVEEEEEWTPDDLPMVDHGRQIGISEVILSLVAFVGAIFVGLRFRDDHLGAFGMNQLYDLPANTPIFNPDLSQWWGIGFIALMLMSLLVSIWSFVRGKWSTDILGINLIENGIWVAFLLLLADSGDIINPEIIAASSRTEDWALTGENSNNIIVGIGLLIIAFDVIDAVRGHLKYRSRNAQGIST